MLSMTEPILKLNKVKKERKIIDVSLTHIILLAKKYVLYDAAWRRLRLHNHARIRTLIQA